MLTIYPSIRIPKIEIEPFCTKVGKKREIKKVLSENRIEVYQQLALIIQ